MTTIIPQQQYLETARHRTAYLEVGPADGPLFIFVHGWPELGIVWRAQLEYFAAAGWRCIAPDMRGYGNSSVPPKVADYALREAVADLVELHDALGGAPAMWAGHDWGAPVVWAMASHHVNRCRGVINLNVPYFPASFDLESVVPLVDRVLYPVDHYPLGQWDYIQFYAENAAQAAHDFDVDVAAFIANLYRSGSHEVVGQPAFTATVRQRSGWFGPADHAPKMARDPAILSAEDFDTLVTALEANGFTGPDNWYLNAEANRVYAQEAPNGGQLTLPVLFLHAAWDIVVDTVNSPLAEPMRAACNDLTEVTFNAGHWLAQERRDEVNAAIAQWLLHKHLK
ncbi:MAG: alpha/beta hydrolase [Bacteroidetes bacterium]|nr:alpha/beta hydrolase [Fibrella sp.]